MGTTRKRWSTLINCQVVHFPINSNDFFKSATTPPTGYIEKVIKLYAVNAFGIKANAGGKKSYKDVPVRCVSLFRQLLEVKILFQGMLLHVEN